MSRQRVWFARDCFLSSDDKMEPLGIEFGAAGPFAVEEIMALAKLARDLGMVTVGFEQVRRRAFLASADEAKAIIFAADALGVLTIRKVDHERGQVTVHFARWSDWQYEEAPGRGGPGPKSGAQRTAEWRARERARDVPSEDGDAGRDEISSPTDTVTGTEPHPSDSPPQGGEDCPPTAPKGNRQRAQRAHEKAVAAWAPHPNTAPGGWEECRSTLRSMVERVQWDIYLEPLHPHRELIGGGWALGAPPEYARWVMDRFGSLLAEACSGPVFVVPCATRPTTPPDLANPKEESR